jgi:hypothetical protein
LKLLSDLDLITLWNACIGRGWADYAREYIEPVLRRRSSDLVKRVLGRTAVDLSDLEDDLNSNQHWKSYHWFPNQVRNGATREELINALFNWLKEKRSPSALQVVGNILSNDGTRIELARLKELVSEMTNIDEIVGEVQFNIFRRTLS